MLPIVRTLCVILFLISAVIWLFDCIVTLFFKIANSRNTAAGITTFVGILLEYAFFPTMGMSLGGILRFAAFAIGGAIIGVLLYHWRMHLLMRQTAEELALAS
ncbi:MAG: hypothetical protein A3C06_03975 [Candidatus Taylorbacteria bacterium RIFCSPHIGHO2_02_FULL_46_13]|uniref:Uncharacterized protein n=1 Tax=Candidatus Taylorbacteria bacterium RIFCSPHIGHO2_02_FULL_46_13 TaxID=1802312 RepID=A0A1G2MTQ0_9BACT|nr:MAG: hypothetical protein A3C06_03975 [Candidatus Taylorbacteria bacterium RIFCSPHIGHO2_02_FULL_46_13]